MVRKEGDSRSGEEVGGVAWCVSGDPQEPVSHRRGSAQLSPLSQETLGALFNGSFQKINQQTKKDKETSPTLASQLGEFHPVGASFERRVPGELQEGGLGPLKSLLLECPGGRK